jgi:hypothetical protein
MGIARLSAIGMAFSISYYLSRTTSEWQGILVCFMECLRVEINFVVFTDYLVYGSLPLRRTTGTFDTGCNT